MKKNKKEDFFSDLLPEYENFVNTSIKISDKIEEILKRKKIAQVRFAELMSKSESEICKWLSGTHNFTIKTISKIETVLGERIVNVELNDVVLDEFEISLTESLKNYWTELQKSLKKNFDSISLNHSIIRAEISSDNLTLITNEDVKAAA